MNNAEISWKRILAEGTAIVVSILLAFTIDAWWDDRQARNEEQRVLAGLREELRSNLDRIEVELAYRHAVVESILTLFDASLGKIELQENETSRLIGDVTWWTNVDYSRGVVDALVQGGRLAVIENKDLRDAIASLPNRYDIIRDSERNDQLTTQGIIVPYLNKMLLLPQIANTMAGGRPGTGDVPTPSVYPVEESRDSRELLDDPEFLGILVQEHWNHLETLASYEAFIVSIEAILDLIELELDG